MLFKRIISGAAALVMALSGAALPVLADEAEAEEEIIPFTAEEDKLTDSEEPALSFDSTDYEKYVHLTRDGEKGGIKLAQDKSTFYQGTSLKVTANTSGVEGYFPCSGMVSDADNNSLYPDAPDAEEVDGYSIVGIEIDSADFGLSTFGGCYIYFMYRMNAIDKGKLQGDTVWVYPAKESGERVLNPVKLTVNDTLDDNINQYRKSSLITVPEDQNATKLIFDIPTEKAVKGEVLYLDNITIMTPDGKYVKNVDNYNASAEKREGDDAIKVKQKIDTTDADKKVDKTSDKTNPAVFVIIGVVAVAIIAAVVIIVLKLRKRFY